MRWMRRAPVLIAIAVSFVLPTEAAALVLAPPGHAGANQYFETIPSSAGDAAPPGSVSGSGTGNANTRTLSGFGNGRAAAARLSKLGQDGQAAAALAASTAPSSPRGATRPTPGSLQAASNGAGGSVATGLSHALAGSDAGGLGLLLPLLLATGLVVAIGIAAARLRRGEDLPPGSAPR